MNGINVCLFCGGKCCNFYGTGTCPKNLAKFAVLSDDYKLFSEDNEDYGMSGSFKLDLGDNDPVNSPSHYASSGVETIDAIEAWELGFNLGNAVKYISRAGKKDPNKLIEDLEKSLWYINREIKKLKKTSK